MGGDDGRWFWETGGGLNLGVSLVVCPILLAEGNKPSKVTSNHKRGWVVFFSCNSDVRRCCCPAKIVVMSNCLVKSTIAFQVS